MWRKERPGVGLWGWTRKGGPGNGVQEEQESQRREGLRLRDKGKSTNMQTYKEGVSTSLRVLSKREA